MPAATKVLEAEEVEGASARDEEDGMLSECVSLSYSEVRYRQPLYDVFNVVLRS